MHVHKFCFDPPQDAGSGLMFLGCRFRFDVCKCKRKKKFFWPGLTLGTGPKGPIIIESAPGRAQVVSHFKKSAFEIIFGAQVNILNRTCSRLHGSKPTNVRPGDSQGFHWIYNFVRASERCASSRGYFPPMGGPVPSTPRNGQDHKRGGSPRSGM